jgi:hypothetical protein
MGAGGFDQKVFDVRFAGHDGLTLFAAGNQSRRIFGRGIDFSGDLGGKVALQVIDTGDFSSKSLASLLLARERPDLA